MVRKLLNAIRGIPAFVARVQNEPVMLATFAIILFQAYQDAVTAGLSGENLLIAIAEAAVGILARQLVYPAVKVDAATNALKNIEPELEKPYLGETA